MANNDVSVEDEELRHYIWLQVDLATRRDGHPLGDNTVNESTKNLMEFIKQREHEAELRGQIALARKVLAVSGGHHLIKGFTQAKRLQLLTDEMNKIIPSTFGIIEDAPTTNDTATDGGE